MVLMPRNKGDYNDVFKDESCSEVWNWYTRTVFIEAQETNVTPDELKRLMGDRATDADMYKCTALLRVILGKREFKEKIMKLTVNIKIALGLNHDSQGTP
jgi:hypothetical protein